MIEQSAVTATAELALKTRDHDVRAPDDSLLCQRNGNGGGCYGDGSNRSFWRLPAGMATLAVLISLAALALILLCQEVNRPAHHGGVYLRLNTH